MYSEFISSKPLKDVCTFGIGGAARYFFEAKDIASMQRAIAFCTQEQMPFMILGKGSNCLFSDSGFDGLVILNKIDFCEYSGPQVYVGAGFSFSLLGVQTARNGFAGLEFASGIPATVGGAIFMNAGAQGNETWTTLQEIEFVNEQGALIQYKKEELSYSYRHSSFQSMKGAIVAARFTLTPSSEAKTKQRELLDYRIQTQPYSDKSAGCVFRNPPNHSAGALIDKCGLKGYSVGGAKVSEMHANFLVNAGEASGEDMRELIRQIQCRVKDETGIMLEQEVRVIC